MPSPSGIWWALTNATACHLCRWNTLCQRSSFTCRKGCLVTPRDNSSWSMLSPSTSYSVYSGFMKTFRLSIRFFLVLQLSIVVWSGAQGSALYTGRAGLSGQACRATPFFIGCLWAGWRQPERVLVYIKRWSQGGGTFSVSVRHPWGKVTAVTAPVFAILLPYLCSMVLSVVLCLCVKCGITYFPSFYFPSASPSSVGSSKVSVVFVSRICFAQTTTFVFWCCISSAYPLSSHHISSILTSCTHS